MWKPTEFKFLAEDQVLYTLGKKGFIKIISRTIEHEIFDGTWIKYSFPWLVIDRGDSVAVIIVDEDVSNMIIIEQFRPTILETLFEIPAGSLKYGEDPCQCAIREVKEEVKMDVPDIRLIKTIYPSPGASSEKIYIYQATVESLGEDNLIGGLKSENEFIKKHIISINEVQEMIDDEDVTDAKTIIAVQNVTHNDI